jgi:hypothetical protein
MKCLALIAILILGLAQPPAKTPVPNKTNTSLQTEATSHADQKPSSEELRIQEQLTRFTGLLVVVGFLQLLALVGQAFLFLRQARIMGQHRVSLEQLAEAASDNAKAAKDGAEAASKNAEFSKLNAIATEKAATAANTSAEAAKRGVEIVISKERARISVSEPDKLVLLLSGPHRVDFKIRFSGVTTAYISESAANAGLSESQDSLPDETLFRPSIYKLPSIVVPTATPLLETSGMFLPKMQLDKTDIDAIVQGKLFVHFWGFIKYRDVFYDVFQEERETTFRYVWAYSTMFNFGSKPGDPPFGSWFKRGAPEENSET